MISITNNLKADNKARLKVFEEREHEPYDESEKVKQTLQSET